MIVTSDMKNFDRLMQLIVSYLVQSSGQTSNAVPLEAFVDEDSVMPIAQLLFDPNAEIARVASNPNGKAELYGVSSETADPPVSWPPATDPGNAGWCGSRRPR